VRIDAIDCPEKSQDFGERAKQFTSSLVFGKVVTVNIGKIDRYCRSVGRVIVDGKDISLELIRAGLAWHYKKYSDDPVLAKAEEDARARKVGLWSMTNPTPPWDYRHRK
jgi:endonuclease YncB( thermonuclease family)